MANMKKNASTKTKNGITLIGLNKLKDVRIAEKDYNYLTNTMYEEYKTIKVDVSDNNDHRSILVDILKQLEKVWWASFEETKEEWTTLLMCAREDPNFLKIKPCKKSKWIE